MSKYDKLKNLNREQAEAEKQKYEMAQMGLDEITAVGICPCCGKSVIEKSKGFFCESKVLAFATQLMGMVLMLL